jgi:hypothetical protein
MKVFISWSGVLSKELGEALRDWIPVVLQAVNPYFTPSDVEKGTRWSTDIARELEGSSIGILCITRENINSPWMLFEAGALSKSLEKSHVCPMLFGITNTDLAGPLKQFQTTAFEKSEVKQLLTVINNRIPEGKLTAKTLETVFEKWWPDLDEKVNSILSKVDAPTEPIRSERDLLEEILQLSRLSSLRVTRTSLDPRAIVELAEKYVEVHDQQASNTGTYQDALDLLKTMNAPLEYLLKQASRGGGDLDNIVERVKGLAFKSAEDHGESDDSDAPF